jgi:glutathione S-transferase
MALEILGFPRSNFVRTVRMAVQEKGVAYELVPEFPHADAIKAIHPLGLIPAMRHDGFELCEAVAIIRYVDRVFEGPSLYPDDPKTAAKVDQWASIAAVSVDQLLLRNYVVEYLFHKDDDGKVVRTKIDIAVKRFPKMFAMIGSAVAPGYFGSNEFSVADCFLAPILAAAKMFPEGQEALANNADLSAYFARVSARDSFTSTAP